MHQKIIYTPQFYCLKNVCSLHHFLHHFLQCSPSRTWFLLLLLRSKHSASGRTIWAHTDTKQYATGSQELVCKGLQRMGQSTYIKTKGKGCSQKVHGSFLQVHSSCQEEAAFQDAKLLWERDLDISVFTKYVFRSPFPFTLMIPRHVHV